VSNGSARPVFPNYLQLPTYLPLVAWGVLRALAVAATLGLAALLIVRPAEGLFLLWHVAIPLVPLVFLVAPGLWRNLCPLAAMNQLPRLGGFTRGLTHTPLIREYSYVIGIFLLFALASARKFLFNHDGAAAAALILGALALAFAGGVLFKGKSGWCSSLCPLLPVQRLYGQTPFVAIANAHCRPCVGCTKNCYDFNPSVAYLADQYDADRHYVGYRRFFAAVFPGFVLAFYVLPAPPQIGLGQMYLGFAIYMGTSLALFAFLDTFLKATPNTLTVLFGAAAFNVYYWFSAVILAGDTVWAWAIRAAILAITLVWLARAFATERRFVAHAVASAGGPATRVGSGAAIALERAASKDAIQVTFEPGQRRVAVAQGETLLAVAEQSGLKIEAGCRMGICGADPVAVLEGVECLSPCEGDEKTTLERLGLAENTRLACSARVKGPVTIGLQPQKRGAAPAGSAEAPRGDPAVGRVVILGNGIAGVTAAEQVRKLHPACEISIVGREKFPLYNRMGITRLIYGRSAMHGLYLLPESWYEDQRIDAWLNTRAERIDLGAHKVLLATGEELAYDRLIIATGSSSYVPQVEGFGAAGCFVLREAEDAMHIRTFAQERHARSAVVAGGGLLGIEAAYALHKLGLRVSVLERGRWPLRRQVDERGGVLLRDYLNGLGLDVQAETELARLTVRDGAVGAAVLKDGREMPCDMLLLCAGIRPNTALAEAAGLKVNRGIVVDEHMRTSSPDVFCVGDAAEFRGEVYGLWPASVEQGSVAAANAVGERRRYDGTVPSTMLKVVGADLASVGRIEPKEGDEVLVHEETETRRYAKLIVAQGRIAGAIMIGYPVEAALVTRAVKSGQDVGARLDALRRGDWQALERAAA